MCSPDLCKGICCICYGTLTPENTLYDDLHEGRGGIHKGICAYHAGIVPAEHQKQYDVWMSSLKTCPPQGGIRGMLIQGFYQWVASVAEEDYYDNSGPE